MTGAPFVVTETLLLELIQPEILPQEIVNCPLPFQNPAVLIVFEVTEVDV